MCNYNDTIESIDYKGYTINIKNDDDSSSMYWDDVKNGYDESIVHIYGNRDYIATDTDRIIERINKELINKKSDIQNYCYYYALNKEERNEVKSYCNDYYSGYMNASIKEIAEDILGIEQEDLLMRIMDKLHIKYDWYESRGYSQGDYLKVILIENDGFIHNRDYINKCLWGGFVGYEIEGKGLNESCWGYDNEDYAISEAKEIIDYHINELNKKRTDKLKELIKNNVSIDKRVEILKQFNY